MKKKKTITTQTTTTERKANNKNETQFTKQIRSYGAGCYFLTSTSER